MSMSMSMSVNVCVLFCGTSHEHHTEGRQPSFVFRRRVPGSLTQMPITFSFYASVSLSERHHSGNVPPNADTRRPPIATARWEHPKAWVIRCPRWGAGVEPQKRSYAKARQRWQRRLLSWVTDLKKPKKGQDCDDSSATERPHKHGTGTRVHLMPKCQVQRGRSAGIGLIA